jgi:SulP family sulfate permease
MTAIGVIIILTQILPAVGYYPKEDLSYVDQYKPHAEELILRNILEDEAKEGILVLEDFEETIEQAGEITEAEILQESKTLAGKEASGVIGAIKLMPRAFGNINWIELLLALGTIIIIYGFKRITKVVPSTLVALIVMSGIADLSGINYRPVEKFQADCPFQTWNYSLSLI